MYDEKMGQIHFWLMFAGQNIAFFPMHFTGMNGMPRRIYTYYSGMGWDFWNLVSTAGAFLLLFGFLFFIYNMWKSWKSGEAAEADPWDGRTLEWSIPSPPPEYNFAEIPEVEDRDDWWEKKQRQREEAVAVPTGVPVVAGGSDDEEQRHPPAAAVILAVLRVAGPVHRRHGDGLSDERGRGGRADPELDGAYAYGDRRSDRVSVRVPLVVRAGQRS